MVNTSQVRQEVLTKELCIFKSIKVLVGDYELGVNETPMRTPYRSSDTILNCIRDITLALERGGV